jgi:LysR family transcriptional regulator, transcriptional activator of the cysJI operon
MNLEQIRVFLTLCEEKSFSKTAKKLYQSQPSISQKISQLEKEFKCILVERSQHGIQLTEKGKILRDEAQEIDLRMEKLRINLLQTPKNTSSHIRLACSDTVGAFFLPKHLAYFRQNNPQTLVTARVSISSQIVQSILDENVDFGFFLLPESDPRIECIPVLTYKDVLVFSSRLSSPPESLSDLKQILHERLLLPGPNTKTRKLIENAFHREGLQLPETQEVGSVSVLREFVRIGLGLGICPDYAIQNDSDFHYLELPGPFERRIALGHRKDRYLSDIEKAFVKGVTELCANENEIDKSNQQVSD